MTTSEQLSRLERDTRVLLANTDRYTYREVRSDILFLSRDLAELINTSPELSRLYKKARISDSSECTLVLEPRPLAVECPRDNRIVATLTSIESTLERLENKLDVDITNLASELEKEKRIVSVFRRIFELEEDEEDEEYLPGEEGASEEEEDQVCTIDTEQIDDIQQQLEEISDWTLSRFYVPATEKCSDECTKCFAADSRALSTRQNWLTLLGQEDDTNTRELSRLVLALHSDRANPKAGDYDLPQAIRERSILQALASLSEQSVQVLSNCGDSSSYASQMSTVWRRFIAEFVERGLDASFPSKAPEYTICNDTSQTFTAWQIALLDKDVDRRSAQQIAKNLDIMKVPNRQSLAQLSKSTQSFVKLNF